MQYRVSIDTAEKAATPAHDCGIWHMICSEADVKAKTEAFIRLGFTPTVTIEEVTACKIPRTTSSTSPPLITTT